jgi:hypothetical protein
MLRLYVLCSLREPYYYFFPPDLVLPSSTVSYWSIRRDTWEESFVESVVYLGSPCYERRKAKTGGSKSLKYKANPTVMVIQ